MVLGCLSAAIWFSCFWGLPMAQGAESEKGGAKVNLSQQGLAMQGVWKLDEKADNPVLMAHLVVHGDYFLLIYQFPDRDATVIEATGAVVDDRIRNGQGEPVLDYVFGVGRRIHVEVKDQSDNPTSRLTEFTLVRTGRFPDLGLGSEDYLGRGGK